MHGSHVSFCSGIVIISMLLSLSLCLLLSHTHTAVTSCHTFAAEVQREPQLLVLEARLQSCSGSALQSPNKHLSCSSNTSSTQRCAED